MDRDEIKKTLISVAKDAAQRGPGWSQQGVVLRDVRERLLSGGNQRDLSTEQAILEVWHDLFADRVLAWGYDLDNSDSPFFHVRKPT